MERGIERCKRNTPPGSRTLRNGVRIRYVNRYTRGVSDKFGCYLLEAGTFGVVYKAPLMALAMSVCFLGLASYRENAGRCVT